MAESKTDLLRQILALDPTKKGLQNTPKGDLYRILEQTRQEQTLREIETRENERQQRVLDQLPSLDLPNYTALSELSRWQASHQATLVQDLFDLMQNGLEIYRRFLEYEAIRGRDHINGVEIQPSDRDQAFERLKNAVESMPLTSPELPEGLINGVLAYLEHNKDPE